jgi:hypothetical protein
MVQFFEELKTHSKVPYRDAGEELREILPPA